MNRNERLSQNKKPPFTFRRIKNVLRAKNYQNKLPKGQPSPTTDITNFEQVLIEKMEQHNWILLIACKICKNDTNYITSISYGRSNDQKNPKTKQKIHHVSPQISLTEMQF